MNSSLFSADRTTHLKVVVIGLAGALVVAWIGIAGHLSSDSRGAALQTRHVIVQPSTPIDTKNSALIW
jgi:hypothetical protein